MHRGPHPATQDSGWLCGLVGCPLSFLYLFLPLSSSLSPADSLCCGSLPGRKFSSSHFGPYLRPRRPLLDCLEHASRFQQLGLALPESLWAPGGLSVCHMTRASFSFLLYRSNTVQALYVYLVCPRLVLWR